MRLATGRIRAVSLAVGTSGDVLVAWDARGVLRTRFKPRTRRGFRATETIRSGEAFAADLHPVVTPEGRAVLAWSAQFAGEGGESRDLLFQAAVRPLGGGALPPRGGARTPRPRAARPADRRRRGSTGRVVVAWSGSDGAALDPATGRPTIVWSNRPEGSGGPVAQIATLAQAATRSE